MSRKRTACERRQLFVEHNGVALFHVMKRGIPMQYWFSLYPGAREGEQDGRYLEQPWIDARELPGPELPKLKVLEEPENFGQRLEMEAEALRQRFRNAIDAGLDLAEWGRLKERLAILWWQADRRWRDVRLPKTVDGDDDIPF